LKKPGHARLFLGSPAFSWQALNLWQRCDPKPRFCV